MSKINSYRELIVWQKSIVLVKLVYTTTQNLPKQEIYNLISQIRRSAVSVPSNIAEGFNRGTRKDYRHFLHVAFGSLAELETQLIICKDIYDIETGSIESLCEEISKMLRSIISKLGSVITNP